MPRPDVLTPASRPWLVILIYLPHGIGHYRLFCSLPNPRLDPEHGTDFQSSSIIPTRRNKNMQQTAASGLSSFLEPQIFHQSDFVLSQLDRDLHLAHSIEVALYHLFQILVALNQPLVEGLV